MLAALEDGCETREQIFAHQGSFSLLNNGAAELRAAGIPVDCMLVDGVYRYRLLDQPDAANGSASPSPQVAGVRLIEEDDGRLAFDLEGLAA